MLVRVLAVLPPTDQGAVVAGGATATLPTVGAVGATLAAAETAASTPNSGAAQIQAATLSQTAGRPATANPVALVQSATGTSAPAAPGAVQPIERGAAGAALAADPPPPDAVATEAAATGAAAAETAANAEASAAASAPAATTFSATVVGTSTTGQPILLAGQSLLTLRTASAPTGTTLLLAVAGARAAAPELAGPAALSAAPATLPSLVELVRAAQTVGGQAQAAVSAVVPQPGPSLAGQMLFYLSALQMGDLRSWIGEPARTALERAGRAPTVSKLAGELKRASDQASRAGGDAGDWRAQPPIPVSNGGAIQPIQLFLHRTDPEEAGNGEASGSGGKPTRFLIDLNLSRLGKIQLDGFAQPPRFDLILRTAQQLNDAMRTELRQLFSDVTSARGLTGSVSFQVAPPIVPTAPPVPRPGILV